MKSAQDSQDSGWSPAAEGNHYVNARVITTNRVLLDPAQTTESASRSGNDGRPRRDKQLQMAMRELIGIGGEIQGLAQQELPRLELEHREQNRMK